MAEVEELIRQERIRRELEALIANQELAPSLGPEVAPPGVPPLPPEGIPAAPGKADIPPAGAPEPSAAVKAMDQLMSLESSKPVETLGTPEVSQSERALALMLRQEAGDRGAGKPWGEWVDIARGFAGVVGPAIGRFAGPAADLATLPHRLRQRLSGEEVGPAPSEVIDLLMQHPRVTGPEVPDTSLGRLGRDLAVAGMFAGGVPAAASRATGLAGYAGRIPLVQRLGRAAERVTERPATFATQVMGGQLTGTLMREQTADYRDALMPGDTTGAHVGRFLWDLSMELFGGIPGASMAPRLGRALHVIPRAEHFSPFRTPSIPIIGQDTSPELAAGIMRVQAAKTIDAFDRMMALAIERANEPGLTAETASRRFRGALLVARDFVDDATEKAFSLIPRNTPVQAPAALAREVGDQLSRIAQYETQEVVHDRSILNSIIRQFYKKDATGGLAIDPTTGGITLRDDVTLGELLSLRTQLIHTQRDLAELSVTSSQGNRILRDNIGRLMTSLTDDIERNLQTADPALRARWEYANNLYRIFNQRFRQGPVGDLLMSTRHVPLPRHNDPYITGTARYPAAQVSRELLNADETATHVWEAAELAGLRGIAPGMSGQGAVAAQRLTGSAESAVRALLERELKEIWDLQQAASTRLAGSADIPTTYGLQRGPAAAVQNAANKFIRDNTPQLERWTRLTADLTSSVNRINRVLLARDEYTRGIATQFIGRPIDEVILQSINAPDRVARFRTLYNTFKNDPDALEGARRALLDVVLKGHGADPGEALSRLNTTQIKEALEELFTGSRDRLARFYDMVHAAHQIVGDNVISTAQGGVRLDPKGTVESIGRVRQAIRGSSIWLAGMIGLITGHAVVGLTPGAGSAMSLSVPMRMGQLMRKMIAATWFRNRVEALSILRDAAFNPQLEAWLMNSAPSNYNEARIALTRLSRWARIASYSTNADVDSYVRERADRAYAAELARFRAESERVRKGPFGGSQ